MFKKLLVDKHKIPPLLGIFTKIENIFRFIPIGEYPNIVRYQHFEQELQSAFYDEFLNNLRIVDVRHGKVIMICSMDSILAVWDPITGNTIFTIEPEVR
jgi:hypothetical protein